MFGLDVEVINRVGMERLLALAREDMAQTGRLSKAEDAVSKWRQLVQTDGWVYSTV